MYSCRICCDMQLKPNGSGERAVRIAGLSDEARPNIHYAPLVLEGVRPNNGPDTFSEAKPFPPTDASS